MYLQSRQRPKSQRLDTFPESLIFDGQQGNVALYANCQHLCNELLVISSSLHFDLFITERGQTEDAGHLNIVNVASS